MEILLTIGLMLLALTILIVIHELGHFWAARIFGMRVEQFALFFGKKLWGMKRGDTEWRINAVPLGGYVKISGMLDEHLDEESLKAEPQPWEFRAKPIWQRLIVMLGGIIMNVILGCIIFIGIKFANGDDKIANEKLTYGIQVPDSSIAADLGFKTGDRLVSYRGEAIKYFDEVTDPNILVDRGKYFEVERSGKQLRIDIPDDYLNDFIDKKKPSLFSADGPTVVKVRDTLVKNGYVEGMPVGAFLGGLRDDDEIYMIDSIPMSRYSEVHEYMGARPPLSTVSVWVRRDGKELTPFTVKTDSSSLIGIWMSMDAMVEHIDYGFFQAIPVGIGAAFQEVSRTVKGLLLVVTGNADPSKSLSGPIKIAQIYGRGFQTGGWGWFWKMTGLLSMVLAVMNLLPIPVLDGGHVLMLSIEGIIGREIPIKTKIIILNIGLYIVIALMAYILINDILNPIK